jgi:hypothetical protein
MITLRIPNGLVFRRADVVALGRVTPDSRKFFFKLATTGLNEKAAIKTAWNQ